ncbi:hypothetical protein D7S86_09225 [Pararobbsia silviterrae]|uniref:Uncharacterized protein n=1 Tax=Pararobbsia silviterrae TaxID=1792498 RepID=A0A494Y1A0_9BURK|nr:hypothetical protein D7S86_09225 [Pararobbsia silviterrae]
MERKQALDLVPRAEHVLRRDVQRRCTQQADQHHERNRRDKDCAALCRTRPQRPSDRHDTPRTVSRAVASPDIPMPNMPMAAVPMLGASMLGDPMRSVAMHGVPMAGIPILGGPMRDVPTLGQVEPGVVEPGVEAPDIVTHRPVAHARTGRRHDETRRRAHDALDRDRNAMRARNA